LASLNETTKIGTLAPVFADNVSATGPSGPSGAVTLDLTDPDIHAMVPPSGPLFGNDFAVVAQTAQQVIFVHTRAWAARP
jgi:hypothetical protein